MSGYQTIVVGAGCSGLTCAAYLAKAGRKVLVLEARDIAGGVAAGPEIGGQRSLGPVDSSSFREQVASDLGLAGHGLTTAPGAHSTLVVGEGGRWVRSSDRAETRRSLAEISKKDADGYAAFCEFIDKVKHVVQAFSDRPPLDVVNLEGAPKWTVLMRALGIRRLGRDRMLDLMRIAPMTAADWLGEYFESGLVKAGIAVPALAMAHAGPLAPGTAANVLLAAAVDRQRYVGGGLAVTEALARACRERGAEIATSKIVTGLIVEHGRAVAVTLNDGATLEAESIVCACDPRQALLDLVPRGVLPARTLHRIENWRARGTIGHLVVGIEGNVELGDSDRIVVVDDLLHLERAFDATKYDEIPERPALEVSFTKSANDALASIRIHHLPTSPASDYTHEMREQITEATLRQLEVAVPGIRKRAKTTQLRCPPDLGAEFRSVGGHIAHGEAGLDQLLVRPIPECCQYKTPIGGLFLASGGTHGGAEMSGLAGAFAARAVLAT